MKTIKKITALTCALATTLLAVQSAPTLRGFATEGTYATLSEVEFWGAYSSEKILQDKPNMYDAIKQEARLNVEAIGGEEEAAQIIMTSGENPVQAYDVVVNDLQSSNGETFSKANIKVYHERYIQLTGATEYYTTPGYYPDCLVPFEGVKRVGETGFAANSNQGLYVGFDVPETQAPGTYTGSMQVIIGGESKSIPITLTVARGNIGVETHAASSFLNEWYFYRGELDTTEQMYEAYNQKLFDYRLGCNNVTVYKEDVEYYAEKVCEYAKQVECPGYNIPWFSKNYQGSGYVLNGRELSFKHSYDVDKMQLYLRTIAYKGLEEGVDPFKKAFIYGWDEPDLGLGVENAKIAVKEWSYIVKQCKLIVAEQMRADDTIENTELLEEMLESLVNVPHLVLSSTFLDNGMDLETEDIVYCPEFQYLQTEGARETYRLAEDNELWWYGCVQPDYPYPTYHIDDTVLSARLESWMKADYNIKGNLYWSTCLYSEASGTPGVVVYPEDFYSGNAARSLSTNGEGFLFYPGKKYGYYGPLPSVRLEQIRDGLEEYEMLYKMADIYASVGEGYTEDAIMRYLYDSMYSGTKVGTTSDIFEQNRALLLDLFELACSPANVCITDVKEEGGGYLFDIYANAGYSLQVGGQTLTGGRAVEGGTVYEVQFVPEAGKKFDLQTTIDGQTYGFARAFGSEVQIYDAAYAIEKTVISKRYIGVETTLVDAITVNAEVLANEKYVQLKLATADKAGQDFLLKDDSVIKTLNADVDKFVIRLYNASSEKIYYELLLEYGSSLSKYDTYLTDYLKPGMNTLYVRNFAGFKWKERKFINSVRICIGKKGDTARDYIYFVDMSVYKK